MTQDSWLTDKRAKADAAVVAAQAALAAAQQSRTALDTPIPPPVVSPPQLPPSNVTQTITYQPTTEDFPNPQRGMQDSYEVYWTGHPLGQWTSVAVGETTPRRVITLTATESALSASFLSACDVEGANWVRMGVSVDLRFLYANDPGQPEPSFAAMLRHQVQLVPFLNKYAHVINMLELGMIGPWGEGHSVTAVGIRESEEPFNGSSFPKRLQLLRGWLAAANLRSVAFRYAWQGQYFEQQMSTAERVRLACNNDQFLAGDIDDPSHGGTFKGSWSNTSEIDAQKAWLAKFTETHQFRAESDWPKDGTYGVYARAHVDDDGPARYHASTWRDIRGLLPSTFTAAKQAELKRRLGYRLVLNSATLPTSVVVGQQVTVSFNIVNEGYARPSRPRPMYLSFNGRLAPLIGTKVDVQLLVPGQHDIVATVTVPVGATSGPLALALPDAHAALAAPKYSIRLANIGVWDAATGYNKLNANVTVTGT